MRPYSRTCRVVLLGALIASYSPCTASAQSQVVGDLTGRVTGFDGNPVSGAIVTLRSSSGTVLDGRPGNSGEFRFRFLAPDTYELRIEALGFRPSVAPGLRIVPGRTLQVPVRLVRSPPPVDQIDTLVVSGGAGEWLAITGTQLGEGVLEGVPDEFDRLATAAALAPGMDPALGSEGLPGKLTHLQIDGAPFYRASHPRLRGSETTPIVFGRALFTNLTVQPHASDIEWTGAPGAYVFGSSRATAGAERSWGIDGSWSGDPVWSSSELDFDAPSLASFWGSARVLLDLKPDTSSLFFQGDGFRVQRPLAPRVSSDLAEVLALDPAAAELLTEPVVEDVWQARAHAHVDRVLGSGGRIDFRIDAAREERKIAGPDPYALVYGVGLPGSNTEYSVAGAYVGPIDDAWAVELRLGGSGSDLSFESSGDVTPLPPTLLAESASSLGALAGAPGSAKRDDLFFTPSVRYRSGGRSFKTGGWLRSTRHEAEYGFGSAGSFVFGSPLELASGEGTYSALGPVARSGYRSTELGVFAQFGWSPIPGLELILGGRYDSEWVPRTEVPLNEEWLGLSGLPNAVYPGRFDQAAARVRLSWDPTGTGATRISAGAGIHHGDVDPGLFHEFFSTTGAGLATRRSDGLAWPTAPTGAGVSEAPLLALVSPDTEAPQTERVALNLRQKLYRELTLSLSATYRRTDFLQRRRDLNRPMSPLGTDPYGREVWGSLEQFGAVVAASPGSNRLFPEFDAVWSLDTDGWSEYRGLTAGLEYSTADAEFFAAYTYSETEDNWVGGSRGHPGAELRPGLPVADWDVGVSDFDVPHRMLASARFSFDVLAGLDVAGHYRFESGRPFTPGYRQGIDVNGDGSGYNDVAWVPGTSELGELATRWACLRTQSEAFATRNGCRGPDRQSFDLGISLEIRDGIAFTVDGMNLIETADGFVDSALWLVDPDRSIDTVGPIVIPTTLNPSFGEVLVPASRGRTLRIGVRIGGGR